MSEYCKYYKENEEVSYDGGITWEETQNYRKGALYESYSHDCGYVPTDYRWVTVSGGYECSGTTKMTQQKKQVSHDSGATWEDVVPLETMATYPVIEYRSVDCGYIPPGPCDPIYRWNDVGYCCFDGDRYIVQKYQVSYDCGETWEDVPSAKERLKLDSFMTCDCGWKSEYVVGTSGYVYIDECGFTREKWDLSCNVAGILEHRINQVKDSTTSEWVNSGEGGGTIGYSCDCPGNALPYQVMEDDDKVYASPTPTWIQPHRLNCDGNNTFSKNEFNYNNAKYVALGNCVNIVREGAFINWENLEKLVLPYSIDYIRSPQISVNNYVSFKKVVSLANTPPILEGYTEFPYVQGFPTYFLQDYAAFNWFFKDLDYQSPVQYDYIPIAVDEIYVPSASYEDYKSDDRWTKNAPPTSSINPYLWSFIRVKYNYGANDRITGEYVTGTSYSNFDSQMLYSKGVGISSIVDYYIISSSQPSSSDTGWTTNVQSILPMEGVWGLWNYKVITYNDNTVITTEPSMIDFLNNTNYATKIINVAYYYKASPHVSGVTPTDYSWYQYGDKIKAIPCAQPNSIPLYRWVVNSNSYECAGTTKITQEKQQVSYDSGSTWSDVSPLKTRIGHEVIAYNSTDCGYTQFNGKYKLTLGNGTVISAACDSTSAITQEEVVDYKDSAVSLVIGDCVTSIDYDAFNHFTSLTSLTIGNNVTNIRNYSFAACSGLTSLVIPNSVTEIGRYGFSDCWSLETVILGSGLTSVYTSSFRNCYNLRSITNLATTPPYTNDDTFNQGDVKNVFKNTPIEAIYVPCNSLEAYKEAFEWANYGTKIIGMCN